MAEQRVTHDPSDPEFPHGTNPGWYRGCPCDPCHRAHSRLDKHRALVTARGGRWSVDAAEVAQHLNRLIDKHGFAANAIGRAAGVGGDTVSSIARGRTTWVRRTVAAKLLAVTPDLMYRTPRVTAPAKRALQQARSMMALGWSSTWIAAELRLPNPSNDGLRILRDSQRIDAGLALRISQLAERIGHTRGPSARTATMAAGKGWYPPAAYDEDGDLIAEAVAISEDDELAAAIMRVLRMTINGASIQQAHEETGIPNTHIREYRATSKLQRGRPRVGDGGKWFFTDPEAAQLAVDICDLYEYEGWTAQEALDKLGIVPKPPSRRGPKRKVARAA